MNVVNIITEIISSVGFPIAACCFMGWFCVKSQKQHADEAAQSAETYSKLSESIDNNTKAINSLLNKMEGKNNDNI